MDWQLHSEMPVLRENEPCPHDDFVWTGPDSIYCHVCGSELCAETSTWLRDQMAIGGAYAQTA